MIIPGETPDAHIGYGAGGLSYSSSGSVGSGLRSAAGPVLTETRSINKTTIEQLAFNRLDTIQKSRGPGGWLSLQFWVPGSSVVEITKNRKKMQAIFPT